MATIICKTVIIIVLLFVVYALSLALIDTNRERTIIKDIVSVYSDRVERVDIGNDGTRISIYGRNQALVVSRNC